ncbi:rhomboid family intramembrane serine protease [Inquilinus sp. CAU 1745]|uniref:rhomboid family intramembrane serine protease n=1 Tax=Inquilinus sp. CAU 1745 TaxID=3140369 RepID=UPI00325BE09B
MTYPGNRYPASPPPDDRGGQQGRTPIFNVPPVTLTFASLLAIVFGLLHLLPPDGQDFAALYFSVVPTRIAAALETPFSLEGLWTAATLLTHAFIHFDGIHLIANVGFLLAFGSGCERALGVRRYLLLLVGSAVAGALVQTVFDWNDWVQMYGASGAVSGCVGGVVRLMATDPLDPRRRRLARNIVIALVGANVIFALVGGALFGLSGEIAWPAHLGGFAAGLLIARRPPPQRIDILV